MKFHSLTALLLLCCGTTFASTTITCPSVDTINGVLSSCKYSVLYGKITIPLCRVTGPDPWNGTNMLFFPESFADFPPDNPTSLQSYIAGERLVESKILSVGKENQLTCLYEHKRYKKRLAMVFNIKVDEKCSSDGDGKFKCEAE
ncbi:MAG: hypothetical protein ACRC5A_13030 [Enterobacteriaceae bacterium]